VSNLREEILNQITEVVDEALADAPEKVSETAKKQTREEIVAYSRRVIDSCSAAELRSERALERFLETAVEQVRRSLCKGHLI
jgi:hypothetical protein